jgi:hypothetical protein
MRRDEVSERWMIVCRTCKVDKDYEGGMHQGLQEMRQVFNARDALASLAEKIGHSTVLLGSTNVAHIEGYSIRPSWFLKHRGHDLVVQDEYGKIDGTCGEHVECDCGNIRYCVLPLRHNGKCSFKEAK